MEPFNDPFRPERVDEQIEWLAQQVQEETYEADQSAWLIQHLQGLYARKRQKETLEQAWASIARIYEDTPAQDVWIDSENPPQREHLRRIERKYEMDDKQTLNQPARRRRLVHRLSTLVALLIAVAIIGSVALVYSNRGQVSSSAGFRISATPTPTPSSMPTTAPTNPCVVEDKTDDPGATAVCQKGLETSLGDTRTTGNDKITFLAGYADTQRILLKYSVSGVKTTEDSKNFWSVKQAVMQGGINLGGSGNSSFYDPGTKQFIVMALFSTQNIPAGTKQLLLTVTIEKNLKTVVATVSLTTSIPMNMEKREFTPRQTVTVNGQAVTLERVIVTPSQTVIYLSGHSIAQTSGESGKPAVGTLSGNGWTAQSFLTEWRSNGVLAGGVLTWPDWFIDKTGQWTLSLQTFEGPAGQGTWTFTFTPPPAQ